MLRFKSRKRNHYSEWVAGVCSSSRILQIVLLTIPFAGVLMAGAQADPDSHEVIKVISPGREIDYGMNRIPAIIELDRSADLKTLAVVLNGRDVTGRFIDDRQHHRWEEHIFATVLRMQDGLRGGDNALIVHVYGNDGRESLIKRKFYVQPSSGVGDSAVTNLPSSVSISSSVVDPSNTGSLTGFSIVVNGQAYAPGTNSFCPQGTTTAYGMQVLVLNRQTLARIDYQCFDTSTSPISFNNYLASLNNSVQPELVIASSFLQASAADTSTAFDTTAIGGTRYGCEGNVCPAPLVYTAS